MTDQPTQPLTDDELASYRQGFSGPYDGHVIRLLDEVDRLRARLDTAEGRLDGWLLAPHHDTGGEYGLYHDCVDDEAAIGIGEWSLRSVLDQVRKHRCESPADLGHEFLPVNGHPDDDECTFRSDGTDLTYCGEPKAAHGLALGLDEEPSDV